MARYTEALVKKASKRLYIIRVLQRCGLPPNDLLLVYFSMVRSILEYACPVWHTMLPKCLGVKLKKFKKELSVLFIRQQITKMLSTSLSASALTIDAKSYVLKRSKRS